MTRTPSYTKLQSSDNEWLGLTGQAVEGSRIDPVDAAGSRAYLNENLVPIARRDVRIRDAAPAVTNPGPSARTREIGIRMALGASRASVVRLVLGTSMRLVASGAAFGLALSLIGGRAIGSFLGGVSAIDPIALLAGPLVLAASALVASYLPARRAARVDPMDALRQE